MKKTSEKKNSTLRLALILVAVVLVTSCARTKVVDSLEDTAPVAIPATAEAVYEEEMVVDGPVGWVVVVGDSLWAIAGKEEVYSVPEQWPLIYKGNLDQIVDADLIYPGQVLTIPRVGQSEIDAAVKHAKTRGAWAVGPVEASDKAYLKNSG